MPTILAVADLAPFATIDPGKAQAMIDDALAMAARVAPCLSTTTDVAVIAAAKAILRGAVLRWHEAGSGALQAKTIGPFGETYDNRQERRGMYWPSEVVALQNLCESQGSVYTISLAGP